MHRRGADSTLFLEIEIHQLVHGREFARVQDNEKLWENFDIDKCQADMMVVLPTSIRDGRCPYDSYKLREGLATQPQSMR